MIGQFALYFNSLNVIERTDCSRLWPRGMNKWGQWFFYGKVSKMRTPCRAIVVVKFLTSDEKTHRGLYCQVNLVNGHFNAKRSVGIVYQYAM